MYRPWPSPHGLPSQKPISYLLDQFSTADIKTWEAIKDQLLKYHWDFYNSLAYQRSKIADKIKKSLLEATQKSFSFTRWQRTLKFKHSVEPLSLAGSLTDPGGRFNVGDINPSQFPPFPALYIASDRGTALQESLSQDILSKESSTLEEIITLEVPGRKLSPLEYALTKSDSIALISISGHLETFIDLNKPDQLQPFVDLLKNFTIPEHLFTIAKKLKFKEGPILIKTVPKLIDALLHKNWREWPMQYDVPVASQVFGQLVMNAGIEGILYPSKFSNKNCLVVFPQNFDNTRGSIIQLDDPPPKATKILKWDADTWKAYGF